MLTVARDMIEVDLMELHIPAALVIQTKSCACRLRTGSTQETRCSI